MANPIILSDKLRLFHVRIQYFNASRKNKKVSWLDNVVARDERQAADTALRHLKLHRTRIVGNIQSVDVREKIHA